MLQVTSTIATTKTGEDVEVSVSFEISKHKEHVGEGGAWPQTFYEEEPVDWEVDGEQKTEAQMIDLFGQSSWEDILERCGTQAIEDYQAGE